MPQGPREPGRSEEKEGLNLRLCVFSVSRKKGLEATILILRPQGSSRRNRFPQIIFFLSLFQVKRESPPPTAERPGRDSAGSEQKGSRQHCPTPSSAAHRGQAPGKEGGRAQLG